MVCCQDHFHWSSVSPTFVLNDMNENWELVSWACNCTSTLRYKSLRPHWKDLLGSSSWKTPLCRNYIFNDLNWSNHQRVNTSSLVPCELGEQHHHKYRICIWQVRTGLKTIFIQKRFKSLPTIHCVALIPHLNANTLAASLPASLSAFSISSKFYVKSPKKHSSPLWFYFSCSFAVVTAAELLAEEAFLLYSQWKLTCTKRHCGNQVHLQVRTKQRQ